MRKKKLSRKITQLVHKQKHQPGTEYNMRPKPIVINPAYIGSHKLKNKVAIITGGDSGIGHSVALLFAKEGADVVIAYLNEHIDAKRVKDEVEKIGRKCLLISGDLSKEKHCKKVINETIKKFGKLNILVNNAGKQFPQEDIRDVSEKQLEKTFQTNFFSYFYMTKAALNYLKKGSTIINTASVTTYKGSEDLLDYSATKGAIIGFTRSLSNALIKKGIRVNAVAPGPIWTPLIPATFNKKRLKKFGENVPMKRAGQPSEVAPSYVFLASEDSSYISGQCLHPNGGKVVSS